MNDPILFLKLQNRSLSVSYETKTVGTNYAMLACREKWLKTLQKKCRLHFGEGNTGMAVLKGVPWALDISE